MNQAAQALRSEEIREIAYYVWEKEGRPAGRSFDHYLKAEKIWEEQRRLKASGHAPAHGGHAPVQEHVDLGPAVKGPALGSVVVPFSKDETGSTPKRPKKNAAAG